MLELRGVTKLYSGIPAVRNINFVARGGEVTGYLGPNGSGKSTTIKMITGLIEPSEGEILFRGEPIDRNRIAFRQQLGYVPEEPHLYPHLTGLEYLDMVADLRGLPHRIAATRIHELLRLLSMLESRHSPILSYSKGMRQKILISAALLHNPELIVLDEPFSGLDVNTGLVLRELIIGLASRQKVVLFSSHELETVERVSSRVVILHKGSIVANDSIVNLRAVVSQPNLEGIFSELAIEQDTSSITREILEVIWGVTVAARNFRGNGIEEGRQFRVLYRSFLFRVVDLELLSAAGEARNLLVQFAALLAAYSFVLALLTVTQFSHFPDPSKVLISAWGMEEFLISTTITVAGMFSVLAWTVILPDRRDSLILDPLPLQHRTILCARTGATLTALGLSIVSVNVFTGISLPFVIGTANAGLASLLRCSVAYWATMAAAGAFVFLAICALQNALALILPFRLFQRLSGALQLLAFFAILALFFLTPPLATPAGIASSRNQHVFTVLPSYWFLGLFQELNGTSFAPFGPLAARATASLAAVFFFTLLTAVLTHRRLIRRGIEQPDIAPPSASGMVSRSLARLTQWSFANPLDRAILLFSARTLARSRQHRLVIAVYFGIACAIALAYAKSLLFGASVPHWERPSAPLLIGSLVLLFFVTVGMRAVAALPYALSANWIFRITAVQSPARYFAAIRKAVSILSAFPVLLACAVVYFALWPGRPALEHMLVLVCLSILLVQMSLRRFRKIPFACSYLPGKANLRLKLGLAGIVFLVAVEFGADIELWSMGKPARFLSIFAFLGVAAAWATWRTAVFAGSPYNRLQFEDLAPADIYALDLRRDSDYVHEGDYLDAVSAPPPRSLSSKLVVPLAVVVLLVAAGFAYEHFDEWQDHRKFPQVGRSVWIGGRSLNLYCAGYCSPTVVFDSGAGVPGYGWNAVEPGVSRLTRACWYDRAGYGWSDPAPRPRSARDVADDLHKLLHAAGIQPPYVLVGHSLGGFHVRVFAARYPSETAGLVLVDSADEYEDAALVPKSMQSPVGRYIPRRLVPAMAQLLRLGFHAGVRRLFDDDVAEADGYLSLHDTQVVHHLLLQPKSFDASLLEGESRAETLKQVKTIRTLGSIPLIVLSGAKKPAVHLESDWETELLDRFMRRRIYETQAHLARLSTCGRQIILRDVGHAIPTEAPAAVVDAVREVLSAKC